MGVFALIILVSGITTLIIQCDNVIHCITVRNFLYEKENYIMNGVGDRNHLCVCSESIFSFI